MPIPRLQPELQRLFADLSETMMGIHYVFGRYAQYADTAGFLVVSANYVVPIHPYGSLPSLGNLRDGADLDTEGDKEASVNFEVRETFRGKEDEARFLMFAEIRRLAFGPIAGPIPIPPPGTPLVLHTATTGDDAFLRFSYSVHDPRTHGGTVRAGTYATPYRDGAAVTSGFSAVAKYALPVPLAAKHVRLLTPPRGTAVRIGASGPLYGQSGGGVEALFPNAFDNSPRPFTIPEY